MSCERNEASLALYVEGDLPAEDVRLLEEHLTTCGECREFLAALGESQRAVHALAEDELPDSSLAAIRERVWSGVSRKRFVAWGLPRWSWALAASMAVVALGLGAALRLGRVSGPAAPSSGAQGRAPGERLAAPASSLGTEKSPTSAMRDRIIGPASVQPAATASATGRGTTASATTAPQPVAAAAVASSRELTAMADPTTDAPLAATARRLHGNRQSTKGRRAVVSPHVDQDGLDSVVPLSEDDAAQLARAVVVLSRIERLSDFGEDPDAQRMSTSMVRYETTDPNVVIYWELAPVGGES